jgi:glycosyltransferase involved in cell wall biosynthesis
MKTFISENNDSAEVILLIEPPQGGHGAFRRKAILISHMIENSIPFILLSTPSKNISPLNKILPSSIKNSQIFKNILSVNSVVEHLFALLCTGKSKINSIRFVSFSEYETIYFFLLKVFSMFRKNLFYRHISSIHKLRFRVLTFSRGDIVSIYRVNNPNANGYLNFSYCAYIAHYMILQYLGLLLSDKYAVQMPFLRHILIHRFKYLFRPIHVICNNLPNEPHTQSIEDASKSVPKAQNFSNQITVALVAPLYKYCKGLDIFIDCCRLLEMSYKVNVFVAGSGPDELFIKEKLKYLSGSSVHFGWLSDLSELFDNTDVIIIPSRYDSCPNLLLEAMTRNSPRIMASNIKSHSELLCEDKLLFDLSLSDFLSKFKSLLLLSDVQYSSLLDHRRRDLTFDWPSKVIEWVNS